MSSELETHLENRHNKRGYKRAFSMDKEIQDARNRGAQQVYETLMYIKEVGNFEENDILIKKDGWHDWSDGGKKVWNIEKFSSSNDAPRKYKVVHIDEAGLPYVMKVSMKGELCGDMKCIAGYDLECTKFEYDPDFLDHQILAEEDEKFDPQEVYKEKRDEYFKTRPKRTRTTADEA